MYRSKKRFSCFFLHKEKRSYHVHIRTCWTYNLCRSMWIYKNATWHWQWAVLVTAIIPYSFAQRWHWDPGQINADQHRSLMEIDLCPDKKKTYPKFCGSVRSSLSAKSGVPLTNETSCCWTSSRVVPGRSVSAHDTICDVINDGFVRRITEKRQNKSNDWIIHWHFDNSAYTRDKIL